MPGGQRLVKGRPRAVLETVICSLSPRVLCVCLCVCRSTLFEATCLCLFATKYTGQLACELPELPMPPVSLLIIIHSDYRHVLLCLPSTWVLGIRTHGSIDGTRL